MLFSERLELSRRVEKLINDNDLCVSIFNVISMLDAIKALSAQPERMKGHWIKISPANIYECSECGRNVMTDDISAYDFCHGCGADMLKG